jgi:hypothetical protein
LNFSPFVSIPGQRGYRRDIHPNATLSQIYFENTFCLEPLKSLRSETGIRVALGDSGTFVSLRPYFSYDSKTSQDGPDTTEIIIFAHLQPPPAPDPDAPPPDPPPIPTPITLHVARITTTPPQPSKPTLHQPRIPRRDDPTPRKPPLFLKRSSTEAELRAGTNKRRKVAGDGEDANVKKAREVMLYGSSTTIITTKTKKTKSEAVFKIPSLPASKGKQKQQHQPPRVGGGDDPFEVDVADVFGGGRRDTVEEENKLVSTLFLVCYLPTGFMDIFVASLSRSD